MDLDLTSDQELLLDATNRFIESECNLSRVRSIADGTATLTDDYRRQAADIGWFAMLVPERFGGGSVSENGLSDAAVIAYARGATLQPGGFVGTNVVALALAESGTQDHRDKVLPALISGQCSAMWVAAGVSSDPHPGTGIRAQLTGGSYVLKGGSPVVERGAGCEWALITASSDDGPAQFLISTDTPGLTITPLDGLDLTRSFCEVECQALELPVSSLVGRFGEASALVESQFQIALVLTVAESCGAMDKDLSLAVQYAKDRIAFGRPIGSFQAVKHLLADTSLSLEMSKGLATAAINSVGLGQPDAGQVASMAKAFVGEAGIELAHNCFQVFGGIGYTWEHDQHLYLRRVTADSVLYGEAAWHRERICQLAGI